MTQVRPRTWKSALSDLRALALGALVAVGLAVCFQFADAKLAEAHGQGLIVPPLAQAEFAAGFATVAAVVIIAFCAPVWLMFAKYRLDRWYMAAALGFGATMAYWIIRNGAGGAVILEMVRSGLPFALCGGVAGVVAWWADRRSSDQSSSSSSS